METKLNTNKSSIWMTLIIATAILLLVGSISFALANHDDADIDNDGFISVAEGVPFYGGIEVSLTETGDASAASALALDRFPVADEGGDYTYKRTFTVSDETLQNIQTEGHIIIHGLDINDSEEYDGEKESSIAEGVPFEATVPVACGIIEEMGAVYQADIDELNSTGVNGIATIIIIDNEVTMAMSVQNTSANLPHAQHIHVGGSNECPPNTEGASMVDDNDNGSDNFDGFEEKRNQIQDRIEEAQERIEERRNQIQARFSM